MKIFNTILLGAILLYCSSCKEKSTAPETTADIVFSGYSTTCLSHGISKVSVDSLVYSFTDSLVIDYLIEANCCPNSNRFILGYGINLDTLTIQIADTGRSECNCVCSYNTHFVFSNLSDDHYFVRRIHSWREYYPVGYSDPDYGKYTVGYDTTYLGEVFRSH